MNSFWNENINNIDYPKLKQKIEVEVCIIGGGLTGISTAYYLTNKGFNVVILEKDKICNSTTGGSTGKITSLHGLIYKYLKDSNNREFAKKYFEANEEAKENIKKIINKENIDCDLEIKNSYVYTESENNLSKIKDEIKALKSLEIPSEFVNKIEYY